MLNEQGPETQQQHPPAYQQHVTATAVSERSWANNHPHRQKFSINMYEKGRPPLSSFVGVPRRDGWQWPQIEIQTEWSTVSSLVRFGSMPLGVESGRTCLMGWWRGKWLSSIWQSCRISLRKGKTRTSNSFIQYLTIWADFLVRSFTRSACFHPPTYTPSLILLHLIRCDVRDNPVQQKARKQME